MIDSPTPPVRTESEVASGLIPCRIGGHLRLMPTLKRKASQPWKEALGHALTGTLAGAQLPTASDGATGGETLAGIGQLALLANDTIADLVVKYDQTNALGGRAWLDEHADDRELYVILRQCLEVHFPFAKDVMGAMGMLAPVLGMTGAVQSPPASSTNGLSPTGTSTPTPSTNGSTNGS